MNGQPFGIWKVIDLKIFSSVDAIEKALAAKDISIASFALQVLEKMSLQKSDQRIELVKVSPKDLGFSSNPQREEIYERAKKVGLKSVPPEIGPQLLLEYPECPNEYALAGMYIGMDAIITSQGDAGIFSLKGTQDAEYDTDGRPSIYATKPTLRASAGLGIGYDIGSGWVFAINTHE